MPDVHALWTLVYEIAAVQETDYLNWFHEVHIPEKLARPGYLTASHYRIVGPTATGHGFIALFGAADTSTFLDPSPAQLRERQDEMTRRMVGCRSGVLGVVLAEEWRTKCLSGAREGDAMGPPAIAFSMFDAGDAGDSVGAWHAQVLRARLGASEECLGMRKMLASIGSSRHAVLYELSGISAWSSLSAALSDAPPAMAVVNRFPVVAERIWPAS